MRRIVKILFALVMALLALLMAVSSCTPQSALTASVAEDSAPAADEAVPEMTLAPLAEDDAVILPGGPGPAELEPAAEGPLSPGDEGPVEPAPVEAEPLAPAAEEAAPFEPVLPERSPLADMTPAERAEAWGLPAPPEGVDLRGREFKLANAYNSITDQRPNHAYGAGVTVDEVAADAFNRFVSDAQAAAAKAAREARRTEDERGLLEEQLREAIAGMEECIRMYREQEKIFMKCLETAGLAEAFAAFCLKNAAAADRTQLSLMSL